MHFKDKSLILSVSIFIGIFLVCCSTNQKTTKPEKTNRIRLQDTEILDQYRLEIAYEVHKNWIAPPRAISADAKNYTKVVFKIMPDGSIIDIFFIDEPRDKTLDTSIIDAIKRTDSFKPHPKELNVPYVVMGLRFNNEGVR